MGDLNKGLKESARGQWSGDVDFNDGSLHMQYKSYRTRLEVAANVGLKGGCLDVAKNEISKDLHTICNIRLEEICINAYH